MSAAAPLACGERAVARLSSWWSERAALRARQRAVTLLRWHARRRGLRRRATAAALARQSWNAKSLRTKLGEAGRKHGAALGFRDCGFSAAANRGLADSLHWTVCLRRWPLGAASAVGVSAVRERTCFTRPASNRSLHDTPWLAGCDTGRLFILAYLLICRNHSYTEGWSELADGYQRCYDAAVASMRYRPGCFHIAAGCIARGMRTRSSPSSSLESLCTAQRRRQLFSWQPLFIWRHHIRPERNSHGRRRRLLRQFSPHYRGLHGGYHLCSLGPLRRRLRVPALESCF